MASPTKSWTVVCFEEDNAVQAVPTKWLMGDNCLWPPLPQEKLNNALKHCEYNSCWPSHKVRIFRNATYDDYNVARNKCAKAEYSSDLNSDPEGSRKRKKRLLTSDSESEEDEIKRPVRKSMKKVVSLPTPPLWKETGNQPSCSFNSDYDNNDTENSQTPQTESENRKKKPSSEASTDQCKCNHRLLYNIQSLLIEVNSKLDKIYKMSNYQCGDVPINESVLEQSKIQFPINTEDKLNDMEQFLSSGEHFKSLVLHFSKMGGVNLFDFIKRCLGGILSDNIAMQYSYIGRKGKKKFCELSLSKALVESAEKSGIPSNRKETELAIGVWLRKAKDRNNKNKT